MENVEHFLIIAGKSIIIYVFIIAAIRIFGKKELAQLSIVDFVFILLISNSVQNAMVGTDSSVPGGLAAALGLFIANYIFKIVLSRSKLFSKIVQGEKIVIVVDGKILQQGLKQSMMSVDELQMSVREHGVKDISEADLVVLEVDGNITVLSKDYSHRSTRRRKKPQLSHNP